MAEPEELRVTWRKFAGLRNDVPSERMEPGDLELATNCDLDNSGALHRRDGFGAAVVAGSTHSLWASGDLCLVIDGTSLKRVLTNYTTQTLAIGLTAGLRASFHRVNQRTYWSNSAQSGIVENGINRTWGIAAPRSQPLAAATVGNLPEGRYQFAMTFVRDDGQESGTGVAGELQVSAGGGVAFSDMEVSTNPAVTHKRLYLSTANGEQLFRALTVSNANTTATYQNNGTDLQVALTTQFLQPPLAGHVVSYYRGHMLVAVENYLFLSAPFGYELFDLRKYYGFTGRIRIVAPVEDGVFVATDEETFFLRGMKTGELSLETIAPIGGVEGTLDFVPSNLVPNTDQNPQKPVAMWATSIGIAQGFSSGYLRSVLEPRYTFAQANKGAGLFRRVNGINQYLTSLSY